MTSITHAFLVKLLLMNFCYVKSYDDPFNPTVRDIKELSDRLMGNYSRHILPVKTLNDLMNVRISVDLMAVGEIDEVEERVSTVMRLSYQWVDESLKWDINEINVTLITLGWMDVWKPVFRVDNQHTDSLNRQSNDRAYESVIYMFHGMAFFDEMMIAKTTCNLDLTYYPFDVHTCFINMSIIGAAKYIINISADICADDCYGKKEHHGLWQLLEYNVYTDRGHLDTELTFERRPLFLVLNILLPIIIVAFLTPIVFILPKKSGERVGFSITMLLALSVYMTIVSDHLPRNSHPMPLILVMMVVWYLIDAAIVLIVILNTKISMFKDVSPLPTAVRKFVQVTHVVFCQKGKTPRENITPKHAFDQLKSKKIDFEIDIDRHGEEEEENAMTAEKLLKPNQDTSDVHKTEHCDPDYVVTTSYTWKEVSGCIDRWCFVGCYFIKVALPLIFITTLRHGCH